ncbi:hypothetical protein SUDANB106_00040 [Streptomyces sp. enrichment culture]|uniref:hypothetical protein n=1 Tax=Streptomyces sp. enrichment culture TaxID=1795815 RepID=UPI003F543E82
MSETPARQDGNARDDAFDAWLAAADAALVEKMEAALDFDAGRAAIFSSAVAVETVPPDGGSIEQWGQLEAVLRDATDSIAHWLALRTPSALPHQLNKAITTTRTMTVVGRALLPESMRSAWGLASDFLSESHKDLVHLRNGVVHRAIGRQEALALHSRAQDGMSTFCAALECSLRTTPSPKARQVGARLLATAEMLSLLLKWTHDSIEYLFDDSGCPARMPAR